MSDATADKLSELIKHNNRMLKDAEAGNWEKVTENEIIRQQLIKTFYSVTSNVRESAVIASATHELLLVNEKLKELAIQARDKVKTDLTRTGKSRAAIDAYAKHMR